jgi:hypothetical protein
MSERVGEKSGILSMFRREPFPEELPPEAHPLDAGGHAFTNPGIHDRS